MNYNSSNTPMKAIDRTVSSLCAQIDRLEHEVEFWREKYEAERKENMMVLNERMADAKQGVAFALHLALASTDAPNGDLVIPRENRKDLSDFLSQNEGEG